MITCWGEVLLEWAQVKCLDSIFSHINAFFIDLTTINFKFPINHDGISRYETKFSRYHSYTQRFGRGGGVHWYMQLFCVWVELKDPHHGWRPCQEYPDWLKVLFSAWPKVFLQIFLWKKLHSIYDCSCWFNDVKRRESSKGSIEIWEDIYC